MSSDNKTSLQLVDPAEAIEAVEASLQGLGMSGNSSSTVSLSDHAVPDPSEAKLLPPQPKRACFELSNGQQFQFDRETALGISKTINGALNNDHLPHSDVFPVFLQFPGKPARDLIPAWHCEKLAQFIDFCSGCNWKRFPVALEAKISSDVSKTMGYHFSPDQLKWLQSYYQEIKKKKELVSMMHASGYLNLYCLIHVLMSFEEEASSNEKK